MKAKLLEAAERKPQIILINALSGFVESSTNLGSFYKVTVRLSGNDACTCPARKHCHHITDFIQERIRRNS